MMNRKKLNIRKYHLCIRSVCSYLQLQYSIYQFVDNFFHRRLNALYILIIRLLIEGIFVLTNSQQSWGRRSYFSWLVSTGQRHWRLRYFFCLCIHGGYNMRLLKASIRYVDSIKSCGHDTVDRANTLLVG